MSGVCAVVPAAGRGSRLGLDLPKILVPVDDGVTIWDMLRAQLAPHVDRLHVVVSPAGEPAFAAAAAAGPALPPVSVSVQPVPTGMGDAILGCWSRWILDDTLLVVWGDQVHVSGATVAEVLRVHAAGSGPRCTIPLVRQPDPYVEYRFDGDGRLAAVLQSREGDACAPGGLADVGVFCLSTDGLLPAWRDYLAGRPAGGVTGEVNFLPFLPYLSQTAGWAVRPVEVTDPDEARGVNTPADLEFARTRLRARRTDPTAPGPAAVPDPAAPGSVALPGKVHMLCPEVPPHVVGGLGRYAERLMGRLATAGVPVDVLGLDVTGAGPRRERHGDVTLHRLGPLLRRHGSGRDIGRGPRLIARHLAYSARAAYRVLTDRTPGAVVAVHDWMGAPAGIACRLAGRPVVFHVHSTEMTVGTTWRTRPAAASGLAALETVQARLAAATIVPSTTMRDQLVDRGWPADRIRVVPHGVGDPDLDRTAALPAAERARRVAEVRGHYGVAPGGRLLVYAGRLSASKGVPTLLAALPRLLELVPDCTLVLCGAGSPHTDEDARVAAAITDARLTGRAVALHRFLPAARLYEHLLAADVCVFPSSYEPFGLVAGEAMALGRPVVLGPGYAPELAGDAALRCTRDDPAELAAVLHRALTDTGWAAAAGGKGRAHAATFRWERTVADTLACYAEAVRR